jgi:hypothetical protein
LLLTWAELFSSFFKASKSHSCVMQIRSIRKIIFLFVFVFFFFLKILMCKIPSSINLAWYILFVKIRDEFLGWIILVCFGIAMLWIRKNWWLLLAKIKNFGTEFIAPTELCDVILIMLVRLENVVLVNKTVH